MCGDLEFMNSSIANKVEYKTYKVMAYITAYEDEQAVLKCIDSLQNQSYSIHKILGLTSNIYLKF